jgi:hypothetical protein
MKKNKSYFLSGILAIAFILVISGCFSPAGSVDGDDPPWTKVRDMAIGTIHAVAYGNGTFVASGGNSNMMYSTDGIE